MGEGNEDYKKKAIEEHQGSANASAHGQADSFLCARSGADPDERGPKRQPGAEARGGFVQL
ncbi:hypothetical protein J28TS4_05470 [Paenibacillus lautus]|nr:hypothetical protein J28TS4_05470 [Paenibacillus lautus]